MELEINGWQEFIEHGEKYLKTAVNGSKFRKDVFTPDLLYNIIAMSIEKHIMGYLLYNNSMPDNHTLRDLVDAVKKLNPNPDSSLDDLFEKLVNMDRFQEICCIEFYHRDTPEEKDIQEFISIGQGVKEFVSKQIQIPSVEPAHAAC